MGVRSRLLFVARLFTWKRIQRIQIAGVGSLGGLDFALWLGKLGVYDLTFALLILPALLAAFFLTVKLVAVVIPLGFVIGLAVGGARTSKSVLVRGLGSAYVDFFRSMPPIVLIAFAFILGLKVLGNSGLVPSAVQSFALWLGVIALGLHTGAYQGEIVRAGLLSVPASQTEAAQAMGLSPLRTLFLIVLPQAFRVSLPALGNEFSSVIKDTSLLSVIGWLELSGIGLVEVYAGLRVYAFAPILVWLEIALLYFVVTFAINTVVRILEEAFKVPGLGAASL